MNILNNYLKKYAFFIFIFLTFIITILRVPFWDETHSFEIASCTIKEIFSLTRVEGHPILWFLILKPFTNINLYPYSMYLINWVFCISSIYILFKKSHFSYLAKTLIAFSTPFLLYFATVSRCYSIGIFLIFLICTFYPKRHKTPFIFSGLIILASQTSLMAMIGVFYIGLIYLFETIKRYKKKLLSIKKLLIIFAMFFVAVIFTISEFLGLSMPKELYTNETIKETVNFILIPNGANIPSFILRVLSSVLFFTLPYFLYKYAKKALFFIFLTYLTLFFIFAFINKSFFWSYYFYFIYLIVMFWIFGRKLLKIKFINIIFMLLLFFMTIPYAVQNGTIFNFIYSSRANIIASYIIKNDEYRNAKLYALEWWSEISPGADIYLKQKNIKLYNVDNIERGSYEDLKNIFNLKYQLIDFDNFFENTPENFYILSDGNLLNQRFKDCVIEIRENKDLIIKTKKNKYLLEVTDNQYENMQLLIYKVLKL